MLTAAAVIGGAKMGGNSECEGAANGMIRKNLTRRQEGTRLFGSNGRNTNDLAALSGRATDEGFGKESWHLWMERIDEDRVDSFAL